MLLKAAGIELYKALSDKGMPVDVKNAQGQTPLMCVAREDTAIILVQRGADVNAKDTSGGTILHKAVQQNWRNLIGLLLERKIGLIDVKNAQGQSPLMCVTQENTAMLLVQRGADVNAKDTSGGTILHKAVQQNWSDLIGLLLEGKIGLIDVKNAQGQTPLMCVAREDTAIILVQRGADVNAKDTSGGTILHKAVQQNWRNLIGLLLERKIGLIDVKNAQGQSPLMCVTQENTAMLLVQRGADVNAKDTSGGTILHKAVQQNWSDLIGLLLEGKIGLIDVKNAQGQIS